MKKVVVSLVLVLLGLGQSFAASLFVNEWSVANQSATAALWKEHKVIVGEDLVHVPTLTAIAYGVAKDAKHPSGQMPAEEFTKKFSETFTGPFVKVDVFASMARTGKVTLPEVSGQMVDGPAVQSAPAQTAAAPAAPVQAVAPVQPTDSAIAVAVANLKGEVAELKQKGINTTLLTRQLEELKKSSASKAEVAAQLTTMQRYVSRLKVVEDEVADLAKSQEATSKLLADKATGLAAAHTSAKAAKDAASDAMQKVTEAKSTADTALQTAEEAKIAAGATNPWVWYALGAIGLLALVGALAWFKPSKSLTAKEVEDVAEAKVKKVMDEKTAAFNHRFMRNEADISQAKAVAEEAREMAAETTATFDFDSVDFKRVWAEVLAGKTVLWATTYKVREQESKAFDLAFVPDGKKLFIKGVKDLDTGNGVALDLSKVKGALRKAAVGSRVVGLTAEELLEFVPPEATDFAETQSEQPATMPAAIDSLGKVRPGQDLKEGKPIPTFLQAKAA